MTSKQTVQNNLYNQLVNFNIPPITARYIAMRLQELNNTAIKEVKPTKANSFEITTDNHRYSVKVHPIDLPDADIKQI